MADSQEAVRRPPADGRAMVFLAILPVVEHLDDNNPVTSDAGTPFRGLTQGTTGPFLKLLNDSMPRPELDVFERYIWSGMNR